METINGIKGTSVERLGVYCQVFQHDLLKDYDAQSMCNVLTSELFYGAQKVNYLLSFCASTGDFHIAKPHNKTKPN